MSKKTTTSKTTTDATEAQQAHADRSRREAAEQHARKVAKRILREQEVGRTFRNIFTASKPVHAMEESAEAQILKAARTKPAHVREREQKQAFAQQQKRDEEAAAADVSRAYRRERDQQDKVAFDEKFEAKGGNAELQRLLDIQRSGKL